MLYSFQGNVLFVHVSRTGGVAIQNSMRAGLNALSTLGTSQHAPLIEACAELDELFDTTFKFAIVRNPWDRLVSWYSYISSVSTAPDLDRESISDPDAQHWKEFDTYLDLTLKQRCLIDGQDCLALSQFHQLADAQGNLLTDDFGRFENLVADVARLFAQAKVRCPPLKKVNQSSHHHYSTYYSAYGRQLVGDLLKDDINRFQYEFEAAGHTVADDKKPANSN